MINVEEIESNNLYTDIHNRSEMPIQVYIGPRGCGKTFSALRHEINNPETGEKFLYLRNDVREAKVACSKIGNAFKSINNAYHTDITGEFSSEMGFGTYLMNDGENAIGYAFGLSTFAGARSVDLSDVQRVIFEEFIPEQHIRKLKNRGMAFLNLLETVGRNRELKGEKPLQVYLLANAINLNDEIIMVLKIADEIEDMITKQEKRRTIRNRGIYIELLSPPVTDMKKSTMLYQVNDDFNKEALKADFASARLNLIMKKFDQKKFTPILSIGSICIYRDKEKTEHYHIADTNEKAKRHLLATEDAQLRRVFKFDYIQKLGADNITFDKFETRSIIEQYLQL